MFTPEYDLIHNLDVLQHIGLRGTYYNPIVKHILEKIIALVCDNDSGQQPKFFGC